MTQTESNIGTWNRCNMADEWWGHLTWSLGWKIEKAMILILGVYFFVYFETKIKIVILVPNIYKWKILEPQKGFQILFPDRIVMSGNFFIIRWNWGYKSHVHFISFQKKKVLSHVLFGKNIREPILFMYINNFSQGSC